jgi:hypothetical protein
LSVLFAGFAFAEDAPAPKKDKPDAKADAYPLKTCLVSGEALGGEMGEPVRFDYKGRTIKFCCNECISKFKEDPAKYIKILDEAEKKAKEEKTSAAKTGEAKEPKKSE